MNDRRCFLAGGVFAWAGEGGETNAVILSDDEIKLLRKERDELGDGRALFMDRCNELQERASVALQEIIDGYGNRGYYYAFEIARRALAEIGEVK